MAQVFEHRSLDVDDQARALHGWEQTYEQLGCGRFEGYAWQLETDEGVLLREVTNRRLRERVCPPDGHVAIAVPQAVAAGSMAGGKPLGRDSLVVIGGREEFDVVAAGELDLLAVVVPRASLERALADAELSWLERAQRQRNLALRPEAAEAIRATLLKFKNASGLAPGAEAGRWVSQALSETVSLAMRGDGSEGADSVPRRADTRMKVVQRAIDFMRANLQNDIGVPEICAAACSSRRSLQYCFEEFLRTTPQAYLRALRLNEARRTLKLKLDIPITAVATTLGFSSASHFTRHYRLMFDELPSETLKFISTLPL